ncbi:MAG: hypothetical protein LBK95_04800 [Bifidobacteriaceae bacterium]|jgi:hypothetical protein|nr:hypothetical protein [Bifidobacteriaceae bacterium]
MNTSTFVPAIRDYAEAVRAALTGLDGRQTQELTDGLELDLADALADGAEPQETGALTFDRLVERFGDPQAYADELRVSAGLPARVEAASPASAADATDAADAARSGDDATTTTLPTDATDGAAPTDAPADPRRTLAERLASAPENYGHRWWWKGTRRLVPALRVAWWVARALIVYVALVGQFLVDGVPQLIGLAILVTASVLAGRVRWATKSKGVRVAATTVNCVLVVVGVFVVGNSPRYGYDVAYEPYEYSIDSACEYGYETLCAGGQPVANIFTFDADGNPVEGIQLFDDRGRPLEVRRSTSAVDGTGEDRFQVIAEAPNGDTYVGVPARTVNGDPLWNVFPLAAHRWHLGDDGQWVQVDKGERASLPPFPGKAEQVDRSSLPGGETAAQPDGGKDADDAAGSPSQAPSAAPEPDEEPDGGTEGETDE